MDSPEVEIDPQVHPSTWLVQDGLPGSHSPVVPPIYQTSLFTFPSYEAMELTVSGQEPRSIYSRGNNPTVAAFEEKIAALEGAPGCPRHLQRDGRHQHGGDVATSCR